MQQNLLFTMQLLFSDNVKTVKVFEQLNDDVVEFYHCEIDTENTIDIMINDNAEWSEIGGNVSDLSKKIGDMIEAIAA